MTNLALLLLWGLLFQPDKKGPFCEDSICRQVNVFKKEGRTKGKD
jgi:hypothetical protein